LLGVAVFGFAKENRSSTGSKFELGTILPADLDTLRGDGTDGYLRIKRDWHQQVGMMNQELQTTDFRILTNILDCSRVELPEK
jgi:hypothetical protein